MSDAGMPSEVAADPVETGDRISFDLLRWTRAGNADLPDTGHVLRECSRRVELYREECTLGVFLTSGHDFDVVASGSTDAYEWLASRYMLPLRPRKGAWRALRDHADEVQRVAWTEKVDVAAWTHWRGGARLREVELGLFGRALVRGRMEPFEYGLWDGVVRGSDAQPRLEPLPEEQHIDIDALIAAEPPENLVVEQDGTRLLYLGGYPEYLSEGPPRHGSGFTIDGTDPTSTARHFLNVDTANLTPVWDDEPDDNWVDQGALVSAALKAWFGLGGPVSEWDWPCQLWRIRP